MISVFLSSTFQDMQHERDLIHKYVYPAIAGAAIEIGESISIVDLRWGIDTSDMSSVEAMDKVLQICSDKVKEDQSFFIAMLGRRYGSKIDHFRNTVFPEQISVTEFEINEHLSFTSERSFFFIRRDIDYASFDPEQKQLIGRIGKNYPSRMVDYLLPENGSADRITEEEQIFIQQVTNKIREFIAQFAGQRKTDCQYYRYIADQAAFLYGCESVVSQLHQMLNQPGKQMLLLHGPKGIGKRSVLYRAISQTDCAVVMVGGQLASGNATAATVTDALIGQIRELTEAAPTGGGGIGMNTLSGRLSQEIQNYLSAGKRPLVVLVKDIELLLEPAEIRRFFNVIESVSLPVKWCVTGTSEKCAQHMQDPVKWIVKSLTFLSPEDRNAIIKGIYTRHSKELPKLPLEALLNKQVSYFPEYISLLAVWMLNFDRDDFARLSERKNDMDAQGDVIARNMQTMIRDLPDDTEQLYRVLSGTLQRQVPQWAAASIVQWLSYCLDGLREEDLKLLTEMACSGDGCYREIEFYLAFRHLRQILSLTSEGVWKLRYPITHESGSPKDLRSRYIAYLQKLPLCDPIRVRDSLLQYIEADMPDAFYAELASIGELPDKEYREPVQTILTRHSQWLTRTIPVSPNAGHLKAVTALLGVCTGIFLTPKQYGGIKPFLVQLFEKAEASEDAEVRIGLFAAGKMASLLAEKNGDAFLRAQWRTMSDRTMELCLAEARREAWPEFLSPFLNAVQRNMEAMEDLAEARSILDRGLPVELCRFVLGKAERNLQLAAQACRRLGLPVHFLPGSGEIHAILHELKGDCCSAQQDYSGAVVDYETSVRFLSYSEISKINYPNLSAVLGKIGVCYLKQDRLAEALSAYKEAVTCMDRALEQEDTVVFRVNRALVRCRIAEIYAKQGNYEASASLLVSLEPVFEEALRVQQTAQSMQDYAVLCYKILEYECQGRVAPERGRHYGRQAAMLFFRLKQVTGDSQFLENAQICMEMIERLC